MVKTKFTLTVEHGGNFPKEELREFLQRCVDSGMELAADTPDDFNDVSSSIEGDIVEVTIG